MRKEEKEQGADSASNVTVHFEGVLSDDYFKARELLYQQYKIL